MHSASGNVEMVLPESGRLRIGLGQNGDDFGLGAQVENYRGPFIFGDGVVIPSSPDLRQGAPAPRFRGNTQLMSRSLACWAKLAASDRAISSASLVRFECGVRAASYARASCETVPIRGPISRWHISDLADAEIDKRVISIDVLYIGILFLSRFRYTR